jgi:hypothetical protein
MRADAAKQFGQLLTTDVVGALLDAIGDDTLRDLVQKVAIRAREIRVDAESVLAFGDLTGRTFEEVGPAWGKDNP